MNQGPIFRTATRPPARAVAAGSAGAPPRRLAGSAAPTRPPEAGFLPTPEAVFRRLFGPAWNVVIFFAWITLPFAFLSAIQDLRLVVDAGLWLYRHADMIVRDCIDAIAPSAKAAVAQWRELTGPLRAWLVAMLPFRVPDEALDLIAINAFCAPSVARLIWAGGERRRRGVEYASAHGLIRFRKSKKLHAAGYEFTAADRRYNQALALAVASGILWLAAVALIAVNWATNH